MCVFEWINISFLSKEKSSIKSKEWSTERSSFKSQNPKWVGETYEITKEKRAENGS